MALGTVSGSVLVSQVWQNVYEVINSNVTDPKSRTKWVYSAFPQSRKGTEDTFPCIVIESPTISRDNFVFGSVYRHVWSIPISVYDTTMATCDTVSDSVIYQIESNKGSLSPLKMFNYDILTTPTTHVVIDGNIIHEKRIEIQFEGVV